MYKWNRFNIVNVSEGVNKIGLYFNQPERIYGNQFEKSYELL